MSDIQPDKLKVAELRDELKARGLDTKGVKAALVERLKEALAAENPNAGEEEEDFEIQEVQHGDDEDEEEEEEEEPEADKVQDVDEDTNEGYMEEQQAEAVEQKQEVTAQVVEKKVQEKSPAKAAAEPMEVKEQDGEKEETQETNGDAADEFVLGDEFRTIDETTEGDEEGNTDRKRRRSRSPRHRRSRSRDRHRRDHSRERRRHSPPPRKVEMDDTEWEALTTFVLDRYESDLNLRFHDNGVKAHPLTVDGFAYMWSGVRSMYGVKAGKIAYEVKVIENLNVDHLSRDEPNPHVLRVGWSVNSSSMNLGEEALSWGYEGTGKSCTESNFNDYGQKFGQGDVVTAYLDMDSDPVIISYAKNGEDLGTCFEVPKEKLGDNALFPHLMTKNTEFECNFGAREGPYFPLVDEFKFLEELPVEERVRGHTPPATKEECEVIMTVGLPGAGKTTYVEKFVAENPEKKWNVLGTKNIIDKMKVMGLPRKENFNGRWEVLVDKANRCLNRLIEIGARKKRNYVVDQTNVYATARRRKMQPFQGFQRKAVVVLPTDEVFKNRVKERTDEAAKDTSENAVNEMKANFSLPEVGECFETVEFIEEEPNKEDRDKLIEQYRKEGRDALPPPEKRYRRDNRDFSHRSRGGYRGGYDRERRGGGFRGRGSSWRPSYNDRRGGYRGGYRDDRRRDDRSYGGGYKGGRGGYGGGGWGGGSGSWGNQGWGGSSGGWNSYPYNQSSWGQQSSGYGSYNQGGWGSGYSQSGGWGSFGYK